MSIWQLHPFPTCIATKYVFCQYLKKLKEICNYYSTPMIVCSINTWIISFIFPNVKWPCFRFIRQMRWYCVCKIKKRNYASYKTKGNVFSKKQFRKKCTSRVIYDPYVSGVRLRTTLPWHSIRAAVCPGVCSLYTLNIRTIQGRKYWCDVFCDEHALKMYVIRVCECVLMLFEFKDNIFKGNFIFTYTRIILRF